ncbi:copper resistance protein CopC [Paludibacterium yongneupense]|uniref:copper resistance protein CopC n=1 Tax=Paludibacterium yongneupense TaxID=400061 RepID=UPI0003FD2DE3|nr:copper resistance protein CopC [Paludibacterium yongneupense]
MKSPTLRYATAAALMIVAGQVWAHAKPTRLNPPAEAVVPSADEVSIDFSETLEPALSSIAVLAADGRQVSPAHADVDAKNGKTLHVALPVLAPGRYQVQWVAVATDGHRTQGQYAFTVK